MATWKLVLLLGAFVFGMALTGRAEPTLVIATGESPPAISEQLDKSFLTTVFQVMEKEMGVKFVFKFMPWKRCEQTVEDLAVRGRFHMFLLRKGIKSFIFPTVYMEVHRSFSGTPQTDRESCFLL